MKILTILSILVASVCADFEGNNAFDNVYSSDLQYRPHILELSPGNDCDFEIFPSFSHIGNHDRVSVPLDHFSNDAKSEQILMPYVENSQHFQKGGPIYILICEKFTTDESLMSNGLLQELAGETHGALFAIGQRCTGSELRPTALEYLSTKQILQDIATFIKFMKKHEKYTHSKVVIAGIRSAGKLALWMKQKFNSLVDVAITDTKPKIQLEDSSKIKQIADFFRKIGGETCVKHISEKLEHQKKLLLQVNGAEELRKREIFCPETNFTDKTQWYTYNAFVYSQLINSISLDQYQGIQLCNDLKQVPDVDKVDYCFVLPNATRWKSRANYLQCNEYGMFATSNTTSVIPLDIPLQWFIDICRQNYGEKFNEEYIKAAVKNTIKEYAGGSLSNVVFLSEKLGVTLRSTSGSSNSGMYVQNWEEHDAVDQVKASVKEYINYLEHRSIDNYSFFLPSKPMSASLNV